MRLLVGRAGEVTKLQREIVASSGHATLEGPNGVGKTSLVAVALHGLWEEHRERGAAQIFLPLPSPVLATPEMTAESLCWTVTLHLAQAFVDHCDSLADAGLDPPDPKDLARWLNDPLIKSQGGGASVAGFSATRASGVGANSTRGFSDSGLPRLVFQSLATCFGSRQTGGFVVLLDNLELIGSPADVRALFETIRDPLLTTPGLRWVLCGGKGMLQAAGSSTRLSGIISDPIHVAPLGPSDAIELIARRIRYHRAVNDPLPPVEGLGFEYLVAVNRGNLRASLKQCQEFSFWAVDNDRLGGDPDERLALLKAWIMDRSVARVEAARAVSAGAWTIFDEIVSSGGTALLADIASSDSGSRSARRRHLRRLEDAGFVQVSIQVEDKRRRNVQVTSPGWLANVCRCELK